MSTTENGTENKVDNDGIAAALSKALSEDESLSDDDRRSIAEKVLENHGGKIPAPVKPEHSHWTDRKLW